MFLRPAGALALVGFLIVPSLGGVRLAHTDTSTLRATAAGGATNAARSVEHRYRIIGKVRFLLFWISSADDVGGARLTWRSENADSQTMALLIGSDPLHAPRGINEWGYIREDSCGDSAEIFGVLSLTDVDSPDDAEARLASPSDPVFGALCSSISTSEATTATSTVRVPGALTYHQFPQLVEAIAASTRWQVRHAARPESAAPGFLIAVDRLIRATSRIARRSPPPETLTVPPAAYLYKETVYDISVRRVQRVAEIRLRSQVFRDVVRSEFRIRNRDTGSTSEFTVTHGTDGALANVPVAATYQPNWWFRIELQLDDDLELPDDPGQDEVVLRRIDDMCARQAGRVLTAVEGSKAR